MVKQEEQTFPEVVFADHVEARRRLAEVAQKMGETAVRGIDPYLRSFNQSYAEQMSGPLDKLSVLRMQALRERSRYHHFDEKGVIELEFRLWQQFLFDGVQKPNFPVYPSSAYKESETWSHVIQHILLDHPGAEAHQDHYDYTMINGIVQSNIPNRYKAHAMIMSLMRHRIGENPIFCDMGTSAALGPKKLLLGSKFDPTTLRGDKKTAPQRRALSKKLNVHATAHQIPSTAVGVDVSLPDDIMVSWVEACSVRGTEAEDEELLRNRSILRKTEFSEELLRLVELDITSPDAEQILSQYVAPGSVGVFTNTTIEYIPKKQVVEDVILPRERKFIAKNGVFIRQDHASIDPKDNTKLIYEPGNKNYGQWKYRTFVELPEEGTGRLYEVFVWKTGRCKEYILGKDFYHLVETGVFEL